MTDANVTNTKHSNLGYIPNILGLYLSDNIHYVTLYQYETDGACLIRSVGGSAISLLTKNNFQFWQ